MSDQEPTEREQFESVRARRREAATPDDLRRIILARRYAFNDERTLQDGIAACLTTAGVEFTREVELPGTRDRTETFYAAHFAWKGARSKATGLERTPDVV